MEPIAESVNELAIELNKYLKTDNAMGLLKNERVYNGLKKILLQSHYDCQTYMKEQCIDLKDFCERLVIECDQMQHDENSAVYRLISTKCRDIIAAVDECVLKCGYSGDTYQFSNGISLYFPWTLMAYSMTDHRYQDLLFNRGDADFQGLTGVGSAWNEFLNNYLSRVTLRPARKRMSSAVTSAGDIDVSSVGTSAAFPMTGEDVPAMTRDDPPWNKGGTQHYLTHFGKIKNFQMVWNIYGFSDESR